MSVVLPFRRPEKKAPPREEPRCPGCGWKLPGEVRADRESVKKALNGEQLMMYLDCPECGSSLFWVIKFDLGGR